MNCVKSSGVQNQTNERDLSQLNTSSVECKKKNVQQKNILWVDVQHFLFPSDGVQSSAMYVFHHVFFANIYNSSLIVAESFFSPIVLTKKFPYFIFSSCQTTIFPPDSTMQLKQFALHTQLAHQQQQQLPSPAAKRWRVVARKKQENDKFSKN